ncbi:hypothetical protein RDWZM_007551, partial [Blomia tropicalis]
TTYSNVHVSESNRVNDRLCEHKSKKKRERKIATNQSFIRSGPQIIVYVAWFASANAGSRTRECRGRVSVNVGNVQMSTCTDHLDQMHELSGQLAMPLEED